MTSVLAGCFCAAPCTASARRTCADWIGADWILKLLLRSAGTAEKSGPDSDDDEFWPGQGVERSTSSVLQTRSGNAHGQSKGAKYRRVPSCKYPYPSSNVCGTALGRLVGEEPHLVCRKVPSTVKKPGIRRKTCDHDMEMQACAGVSQAERCEQGHRHDGREQPHGGSGAPREPPASPHEQRFCTFLLAKLLRFAC